MTDRPPTAALPVDTGIARRVRDGAVVFGAFIQLDSPLAAELAGRAGLDWLLVDLEHGTATDASVAAHLMAVEGSGAAALVRVEEGTRLRIGRVLDLGAEGVMIPRLDDVERIRELAAWLRYPPAGGRGLALLTRGAGLGEVGHADVPRLNRRVLGIVQIESARAVAAAREIASIDNIDVLFVGPTDLSHALGVPGRFEDVTFVEALRTVVEACRATGRAAGILVRTGADAARYLDMGFRFVGVGSDAGFIVDGARAALAAATGAG